MAQLQFFMFLLILIYILSFQFSFTAADDPEYLYHICSNTANFTRNSTYESNLKLLLSSLPTNANRSNGFSSGFYNATAGQDPNKVYGLFLCRGDETAQNCQDCVTYATRNVTQLCPNSKENIVWYDRCHLRYSNLFIFSAMDTQPMVYMWNTQNATDPGRFNERVASLMNDSATQAVNNPKKFATGKTNFTSFQTLYSLVQCTPDLSSSLCDRCLRIAIAQVPTGTIGGRVLSPSCNIRYEVYPFYNETATEPPPPPPVLLSPPPPGSITRSRGKVEPTFNSLFFYYFKQCFYPFLLMGR